MSRITAPVGEVTTPITSGRNGSGRLPPASNSPSAASAARRFSSIAISAPTPAGASSSITIWYFDWPGNVVSRPVATTSMPSSGRTARLRKVFFQITAASTERSSLRSV
jgi:hypothetical protein